MKDKKTLINNNIKARRIILIDEEGTKLGEFMTRDALDLAKSKNLDLVEVSGGSKPTCKLMNYGKFKYDQKRRQKKQTNTKTKEIKLGPMTEEHDVMVRIKKAERFLSKGHRVKVTVRFRGREHAHHDIGIEKCRDFAKRLEDVAVVESGPRLSNREVNMFLTPK